MTKAQSKTTMKKTKAQHSVKRKFFHSYFYRADDETKKIQEGKDPDEVFAEALGYVKADYKKGWDYRMTTLIQDEKDNLYPYCVNLNEFAKYGVGIHLYFRYIKNMAIMFGIMSIIALPSLICNLQGTYFKEKSTSALDFTTLGNHDGFENGTLDQESTLKDSNDDSLRMIIVYSDFINTLFFF